MKISKKMRKFKHKPHPTSDELRDRVEKKWKSMKQDAKKKAKTRSPQSYREKLVKEAAKVHNLITNWTRAGHGHMDSKKADGNFRLLWENFNSLQILTGSCVLQKMRSLDEHRKRLSANMIAGCET